MTIQIQAPVMGESITEATVASWAKNVGDYVAADELIAELETDKINLEVNATSAGVITKIVAEAGATVNVGDLMAEIDESANAPAAGAAPSETSETSAPTAVAVEPINTGEPAETAVDASKLEALSPAVRKLVEENGLNPTQIIGSGKDGRLTKGDVLEFMKSGGTATASATSSTAPAPATPTPTQILPSANMGMEEERIPMSRLRQTIAGRLKTAQNNAAMLTTYNEVDLSAVMELRKQYKEKFEKQHGTKLGFMSFFTKAVIEALKEWPALNAEIDGDELVYKKYYNIGVAVSTERGLVVPVLKGADSMSFADIEGGIKDFAIKGRDGKLMPDDMSGGTFTITNGGTFGSMMSMPILNYPQVGILGMHNIVERPVVVDGEIVIRPMMYLAMTYDHRIVDGREAVSFVVKIKECLENPSRMLLGI